MGVADLARELLAPIGYSLTTESPRPPWRGYPKSRKHTPVLATKEAQTFYVTFAKHLQIHQAVLDRQDRLAHTATIEAIVPLHGTEAPSTPGSAGLVLTEYVDGRLLWELSGQQRPSLTSVEKRLREFAIAAEAAGLVHGDLRPWNVMLRYEGSVAVLDWGFGFLRDSGPSKDTARHLRAGGHKAPFTQVDHIDAERTVMALRKPERVAELWNAEQPTWYPEPWN